MPIGVLSSYETLSLEIHEIEEGATNDVTA